MKAGIDLYGVGVLDGMYDRCGSEREYSISIESDPIDSLRLTVVQTSYPGGAAGFGDARHWNEIGNVTNRLARCVCQKGVEGCP